MHGARRRIQPLQVAELPRLAAPHCLLAEARSRSRYALPLRIAELPRHPRPLRRSAAPHCSIAQAGASSGAEDGAGFRPSSTSMSTSMPGPRTSFLDPSFFAKKKKAAGFSRRRCRPVVLSAAVLVKQSYANRKISAPFGREQFRGRDGDSAESSPLFWANLSIVNLK
jgi:hypothetical protein